jgi:hypothetical protein
MNPISENGPVRQAARSWSASLGSLAAISAGARREEAQPQLDSSPPSPLPTRLSSILAQLRQRNQRREHAADKLRGNEFMAGR